jgi:hypothetical protein
LVTLSTNAVENSKSENGKAQWVVCITFLLWWNRLGTVLENYVTFQRRCPNDGDQLEAE